MCFQDASHGDIEEDDEGGIEFEGESSYDDEMDG